MWFDTINTLRQTALNSVLVTCMNGDRKLWKLLKNHWFCLCLVFEKPFSDYNIINTREHKQNKSSLHSCPSVLGCIHGSGQCSAFAIHAGERGTEVRSCCKIYLTDYVRLSSEAVSIYSGTYINFYLHKRHRLLRISVITSVCIKNMYTQLFKTIKL